MKTVKGRQYHSQVFEKGDRVRLEYKYAIRTERGYAAIEIIRLDKSETWYLLVQRKEFLGTGLDPDDLLPIRPPLPGERDRVLVGMRRQLVARPNSSKFRRTIMVESSDATSGWIRKQEWS